MTYNINIQKEGIVSEFLAILKPARQVTSWTSSGVNIYYNNFTYGYVSKVTIDGIEQTLDSSTTITSGKYYWDNENQNVYIYSTSPSSEIIVVTYELHYGTKGVHWYRDPLDTSTTEVYFDSVIIKSPSFKALLSESLLGYLPSQSSNIIIGNPDNELERHIYDSSFNEKDILIYHWLENLETDNIKLLIKGKMSNLTYNQDRLTINILDRIDILDKEYRNQNNSFYNTTDFPNIDLDFIGNAIRFVYGRVDNAFLVNTDKDIITPTTSNNRIWAVREGAQNTYTGTVPASPSSTTTRTYLDSVAGLDIGDQVWIDKATDEYRTITAVNRTGNEYIEHAALTSGAATTSDTVKRGTLGNLFIEQSGVKTPCYYDRDYTESVTNNVIIITLKATAEINMSINTLDGNERLEGRMYGVKNTVTKGGSSFGSDSSIYNSLTNPAVILFDLLKNGIGIAESEINLTSFDSLETQIGSEEIGFSLPAGVTNNFPSYKNIITQIMRTNLVQLYLNSDNKWEVDYIKVLSTEDVTIQDDEILENSISYKINYNDIINKAVIKYNFKESTDSYNSLSQTSNYATYVHEIEKQKSFTTYLLNSSNASTLATRLIDIYGDRQGIFEFNCKNRFFNNYISDIMEVDLEKHVGFSYVEGTSNSRKYEIIGIDKTSNSVRMKLTDQKGVEDNPGDF